MKNEQKIIKIKKEIIKTDIEKINEEILCLINNPQSPIPNPHYLL